MLSADTSEIVREVPQLRDHEQELAGRAMLCRRTTVFPIECVVRGYLSGSAWKEYREKGTLAGEPLRKGLRESDRLDPPLFSPATKADEGHDENITVDRMRSLVGDSTGSAELERLSREIYEAGRAIAAERGIIIADTKFEFGRVKSNDDAGPKKSLYWWMKCSHPTARASGRPTVTSRVMGSPASTSSRFATISTRRSAQDDGMATIHRRSFAERRDRRHERALPRHLSSLDRPLTRHRRITLNFAREGLLFIAIAAVVAAGAFGFAISRRSWGLWLAAFVLLLLALWVAYFFRDPERTGERGPSTRRLARRRQAHHDHRGG